MDVVQLLPRLHFLRLPVGHAYLWRDPDGLTLIDTGVPGSGRLIAQAIRGLGHDLSDLRRVLLTHFHVDHVGSAAEAITWGDVAVYAHRADAPVIRGEASGPPPHLLDWERPIFERATAQVPAEPPVPVRVDHELAGGETLEFGDGARALSVPGHTPGSVALYLPGPRVLFTGDTVARTPDGQVILGVFNVDPAQAAASFRQMAALDLEIVCFGHGEPLTVNATTAMRESVQAIV